MNKDLLSLISSSMSNFSKGQKAIANFIINHYDKAAFMTASKLGITVGISESTVVRFATEIGYEGYPQLQRALQELIRNRLTAVQRMEVTNDQIGGSDVLAKVLSSDIENIRRTLDEASTKSFTAAVDALCSAHTIYILGIRSASSLAHFLYFYLNHIFDDVRVINTNSSSEMFEQILRIKKGDVFVGITFPRYSQRTFNGAKFASDNGAKVIAITDSEEAPISAISDTLLLARSDMASFVDSLVAPLSLINALIVAVGLRKKNEISTTFSRLEKIWDVYNVYEKTEGTNDIDLKKI
ncbi:MAG: MurR/RpiR family transcriptional regulator [Hydrogenoanaerobacterium sp.]